MKQYCSTSPFKTQAELWKHLLDGGAITNLDDSCDCFVYLKDGNPTYDDGTLAGENLYTDPEWRPFPQAKLIKMAIRNRNN
jgi:hypothetical protein